MSWIVHFLDSAIKQIINSYTYFSKNYKLGTCPLKSIEFFNTKLLIYRYFLCQLFKVEVDRVLNLKRINCSPSKRGG
jgi:hypothetical protein